jgi:4-hydroxy-tetrahydrodipicolinate reductase
MQSKSQSPTALKLALIGYGRMGKAIEEIAVQRGHEIVLRIGHGNAGEISSAKFSAADVAIEFTNPHCAAENVKRSLEQKIPVVCGTTGWLDQLAGMKSLSEKNGTGFIYSSNFSVGVNIFFEVNKTLARLMSSHPDYEVILEEIHHTQKKDAPSGTAITLA